MNRLTADKVLKAHVESVRFHLHHVGGLVRQADIAKRDGRNRSTVAGWTVLDSFPAPVARVGDSDAWAWAEVLLWIEAHPRRREQPRDTSDEGG